MAAIDKMYGTRKQWIDLMVFICEYGNRDWMQYMYPVPPKGSIQPLSNFPDFVDEFLWQECPLTFVQRTLIKQHPSWKNKIARYDKYDYHNTKSLNIKYL